MKIKVHPIQLAYTKTDDTQTCSLCGFKEVWTAKCRPNVTQDVIDRGLHLAHLVRSHLPDVQASLKDRASEFWIDTAAEKEG